MRALLKELKAKGYKIVHIVPKGQAATLPAFDAMAEREAQRRKLALSSQPLADRSVVWPVTSGDAGRFAVGDRGCPRRSAGFGGAVANVEGRSATPAAGAAESATDDERRQLGHESARPPVGMPASLRFRTF